MTQKLFEKEFLEAANKENAPCSRCKPSIDGAGGVYD